MPPPVLDPHKDITPVVVSSFLSGSKRLIPFITALPNLRQLLPIIPQPAKVKHDGILLPRHIRPKDPAVRHLEQTPITQLPTQLRPPFLRLLGRLHHSASLPGPLPTMSIRLPSTPFFLPLLTLPDQLRNPLYVRLDGGWDVGEGPVGARDHEEVGEVRHGDAEEGRGPAGPGGAAPVVFEGLGGAAFDGDAGIIAVDGVEAGC